MVRPGGESLRSSTSGVLPIRSRSELATTGHRRKQDDGRRFADRRVEAVARADVLAVDVDVDERPDLALAVDAFAERGNPDAEVLEQLADRRAGGLDLARAARLGAKHRGDAHDAHRLQNST